MPNPKMWNPESVRRHYRDRDRTIKAMGYPSYKLYLKSPQWNDIKDRVLAESDECAVCGAPAPEVHHLTYSRRVLEGKDLKQLVPLCRTHHHQCEYDPWGRKRSPIQAAKRCKQLIAERGR